MRYFTLLIALLLSIQGLRASQDVVPEMRYPLFQEDFEAAYVMYPAIPKGMLEAVSWTNTRMRDIRPDQEMASCIGMPKVYGVMGLMGDGAGWFRENLNLVAQTASTARQAVLSSPRTQILGYAHTLDALARRQGTSLKDVKTWFKALEQLSEIPAHEDVINNYALQSQLYSVADFMGDADVQRQLGFDDPEIDMERLFGAENLRVLSAGTVNIEGARIHANGHNYLPMPTGVSSADYGPALWSAAASCNYSGRGGTAVSAVTIHTVQGSYAGCISWFQNCAAGVSAHYVVRSSDGQVTQMVLESNKAWHVGTENPYTIGIEHEGYVDDAAWYTNNLYTASAALVSDIAASGYGINKLRTYDGPPSSGLQVLSANCYLIKGHQHYANSTHTDPGINWDWARFYRLINGTPATTVYTAASGTFYDPGGSAGNYGNDVRQGYRIAPTGANSVTLTFSSFNLEANYDFLWIYDGADANGELIGKYHGTTLPPVITAKSGKIFLEFRTDCATVRAGWAASWTSSTAAPACGTPTSLGTSALNPFGVTLTWGAVAGATMYEVRYRHSLSSTWTTLTAGGTTRTPTGLKASSEYLWQVRTVCGTGVYSAWAGSSFLTPAATTTTSPLCNGTFRDSGGDISNYRNSENYTFTISPAGATSVTLSFTSFNMESGYDYMYIYNGPNTSSPLLGTYTGTTSPGTVSSTGGSLTVRVVSDSWTTRAGWNATWTCSTGLKALEGDISAPSWSVAPNPFSDAVVVSIHQRGDYRVALLDLQGRIVLEQVCAGGAEHRLETNDLAQGAYLLQVTAPDGSRDHKRVVKQ